MWQITNLFDTHIYARIKDVLAIASYQCQLLEHDFLHGFLKGSGNSSHSFNLLFLRLARNNSPQFWALLNLPTLYRVEGIQSHCILKVEALIDDLVDGMQ